MRLCTTTFLMPYHVKKKTKLCRSCHAQCNIAIILLLMPHTKAKVASWLWLSRPFHHVNYRLHSRVPLAGRSSGQAPACRASAPKGLASCPQEVVRPFHLLCLQVVMFCNFLQPTKHLSLPQQARGQQCKHNLESYSRPMTSSLSAGCQARRMRALMERRAEWHAVPQPTGQDACTAVQPNIRSG